VNTGKKPSQSSPKYKAKTPRTKTLEKRIKDKGAKAAPQRSHMMAVIAAIETTMKEINDVEAKIKSASADEKPGLEKSLEKLRRDLQSDKKIQDRLEPHVQMLEVIATAAKGLKLRTQMKANIRKEEEIRKERNIVVKAAKEVVAKATQTMRNERDPDLKAEASKRVETALALLPPKEEEAAQQVARVKNLKQQCEELIAAVAEMVDAVGGMLPYVDVSEVDNDILQVGLTAQAKFDTFRAEFESRPMVL